MLSHHIRKRIPKDPWWHVFGLSTGLVFVLMLMLARLYPAYLDGIDYHFERFIAPLQTLMFTEPFLVITTLGGSIGVTLITLGSAYLLRRNWFTVLQLGLLMLYTSVSMGIAKMFVERARPHALSWLDPLNTYSFPSGHASLSTALYGFICVCLYRRAKTHVTRVIAITLPVLAILLICLSRIVLNYHYLSDVAAGLFLGLFWLAVTFMMPQPAAKRR